MFLSPKSEKRFSIWLQFCNYNEKETKIIFYRIFSLKKTQIIFEWTKFSRLDSRLLDVRNGGMQIARSSWKLRQNSIGTYTYSDVIRSLCWCVSSTKEMVTIKETCYLHSYWLDHLQCFIHIRLFLLTYRLVKDQKTTFEDFH